MPFHRAPRRWDGGRHRVAGQPPGLAHQAIDPLQPLAESRVLLDRDDGLIEHDEVSNDDGSGVGLVACDLEVGAAKGAAVLVSPRGARSSGSPAAQPSGPARAVARGELRGQGHGKGALEQRSELRREARAVREWHDELRLFEPRDPVQECALYFTHAFPRDRSP